MLNTEVTVNQRLVVFYREILSVTGAAFSRSIGVTRQAIVNRGNENKPKQECQNLTLFGSKLFSKNGHDPIP